MAYRFVETADVVDRSLFENPRAVGRILLQGKAFKGQVLTVNRKKTFLEKRVDELIARYVAGKQSADFTSRETPRIQLEIDDKISGAEDLSLANFGSSAHISTRPASKQPYSSTQEIGLQAMQQKAVRLERVVEELKGQQKSMFEYIRRELPQHIGHFIFEKITLVNKAVPQPVARELATKIQRLVRTGKSLESIVRDQEEAPYLLIKLMESIFTAEELSSSSLTGKMTKRPPLDNEKFYLICDYVQAKIPDTKMTELTKTGSNKLRNSRRKILPHRDNWASDDHLQDGRRTPPTSENPFTEE